MQLAAQYVFDSVVMVGAGIGEALGRREQNPALYASGLSEFEVQFRMIHSFFFFFLETERE